MWRTLESEVARGTTSVGLFIGPEGGWTEQELSLARGAGVKIVNFGPHIMRIEVAAIAGAAVVMQVL